MSKIVRLFFCILFFGVTTSGVLLTVHAGEINSAESQVISAASGTFTYEGSTYKAYPEYLQQLRDYFSRDDVDLENSEVNGLISDMNASIKDGIDSGYLYKVSGPDSNTESKQDSSDTDTSMKNSTNTDKQFDIEQSIKESRIFYSNSDDSDTTSVEMVIKNTGYNISNMIYIGIGLMILLVLSLAVAVRYDLFAPSDES